MPDRAAMIQKIKALLAKTVENGCTEGEAMAALAKVRQLMDENEISDTDLQFGGEAVGTNAERKPDRDGVREKLHVAVGRFCGCRAWRGGFEQLVYCGLVSETVFAHWLLDVLADFVARELAAYLARTPGIGRVRRRESEAFTEGCCARICERLEELTPEGTALSIARADLIERYMAEADIELGRGRSRFRLLDARAHGAGVAAGDHAQFNQPMGAAEKPRRIGR